MKSKVISTLSQYNMLLDTDKIIIGFSGGADSVCLLHFLNSIKNEYNFEIIATHINHNLRGEESKRDENFAKEFCSKLDIKLEILDIDIISDAKVNKESIELNARKNRYNFFQKIANKSANSKIATAHTASDNLETVLYNITRGCGIDGICGIPPVRDNIIRPLISCTREEIEKYCVDNNLSFVTDSSNLEDKYTRNKIRHNVVPSLKEINKDVEMSVLKLSNSAKENQLYINNQVNKILEYSKLQNGVYDCEQFLFIDSSVLSNIIIKILKNNNIFNYTNVQIDEIKNIITLLCGSVDLYQGRRAVVKQGKFRIISQQNSTIYWEESLVNLKYITKYNKKFTFDIVDIVEYEQIVKNNKKVLKNSINYDIIDDDTLFRNRRSKDYFTIANRNVTKSIKKLFNEHKVLQEERDKIFLIANDNQVLWIENFGASKIARVTNKSKKVLIVYVD